jgi:lysozyme
MTNQRINEHGIALIKQFEGLELKAYPDPGTGGDPWTIGYGHTGPEVRKGLVINQAQADAYLRADLAKFERAVSQLVTRPITDDMFSALVSFVYNLGPANLKASTLLKKLNAGDFQGASDEFPKWNKAAGKVLAGLTKRRRAEQALFRGVH